MKYNAVFVKPVLKVNLLALTLGTSLAWAQANSGQSVASSGVQAQSAGATSAAGVYTGATGLTLSATASFSGPTYPSRPAPFKVEPFFVYPIVGLSLGYTDGVIKSDGSRGSSSTLIVSPGVRAVLQKGAHQFTAAYSGQFVRHASASDDNADNHELNLSAVNQYTARLSSRSSFYWMEKSLPRVYNFTTGAVTLTPYQYQSKGFFLTGGYGADEATGRIELDLGYNATEYLNNRNITARLDNSSALIGGRFMYRFSSATQAFAEIRQARFDFQTSDLDNTDLTFNVGAFWKPTALISTAFRIGRQKKSYDSVLYTDLSTNRWDVTVSWEPLSYSRFEFRTDKSILDALGLSEATQVQNTSLVWKHAWSTRIKSELAAQTSNYKFLISNREDSVGQVSLKAGYEFRRFMQLGVELSHQNRDSNVSGGSFKRSVVLFTIGASL